MTNDQVLQTIRDVRKEKPTGRVQNADLVVRLSPSIFSNELDLILRKLVRAGKIKHLGKRDPKTGKERRVWGWVEIVKSRRYWDKSQR